MTCGFPLKEEEAENVQYISFANLGIYTDKNEFRHKNYSTCLNNEKKIYNKYGLNRKNCVIKKGSVYKKMDRCLFEIERI